MAFFIVIRWNPSEEAPFSWRSYLSKPYATKREAWRYVQRVLQRASLSDVQLHDIAVFDRKPSDMGGCDIDHSKRRVYDHALWRLHGRHTSYGRMFC